MSSFSNSHDYLPNSRISINSASVPKIVAAGRGKSVSLPAIRDKIISLTNKEDPIILYLGTASFDKKEPYLAQTKGLRDAGCDIIKIDVSNGASIDIMKGTGTSKDVSKKQLRHKYFEKADAILASGGDTSHALQRWKDVGIDKLIVEAAFRDENPAVLCGGSAGGICWFSYCHIIQKPQDVVQETKESDTDKDQNDIQLEYFRISGMNIVPGLCVPHHDVTPDNALPRFEDSNRMTLDYPNTPTIGIDEAAALVLVGNQASVVSGDGKAKCYLKRCINDKSHGKRLKVISKQHNDKQFNICDFFEKARQ